jgi:hypothetical protein
MVALKRISVALSLALYLVATTAVHALHNHSTSECCCHGEHGLGCAEDGESGQGRHCHGDPCHCCHGASVPKGSAHEAPPAHSRDCEDSCFACRFLAAKSIATVAVAIVERSEVFCPLDPPQPVFTPLAQPDLPLSRGPPVA